MKKLEAWWVRLAMIAALIGSGLLGAFVHVPPKMTAALVDTEWIARAIFGLGSLVVSVFVVSLVALTVIRAQAASKFGAQGVSLEFGAGEGTPAPAIETPLAELRAVDERLGRELTNNATLLNLVVARMTALEEDIRRMPASQLASFLSPPALSASSDTDHGGDELA